MDIVSIGNSKILKTLKELLKEYKEDIKIIETDSDTYKNYIEGADAVILFSDSKRDNYDIAVDIMSKNIDIIINDKALVAKHMKDLYEKSREYKVHFKFEACCGGALPWLENLRNMKKTDEIVSVFGIFNSTTNYVLWKMKEEGISFEDALSFAIENNYAEEDASDDILGIDSANKLAISASVAFGVNINPEEIPTYGIENASNLDFGFFEKEKLILKATGYAFKEGKKLLTIVAPTLYRSEDMFSLTDANNNFLAYELKHLGKQFLYGQGAGLSADCFGILHDINDIEEKKFTYDDLKDLNYDYTFMKKRFYFSFSSAARRIERIIIPYAHSIYESNDTYIITTRKISFHDCLNIIELLRSQNEKFFFAVYA